MDLTRIVTFSSGGRPILQKDIETGVFYMKAKDSFQVTPGDKHQLVVSQNRRYGGGKVVGESHDNWSVSATWLITGASQDNCIANLSTFLAQLETLPVGDRFLQWRPDGATFPVFFEIRGTAKWNPNYSWSMFNGAQAILVEVSFPIAPLARGYAMDIGEDFGVKGSVLYTNFVTNPSFEVDTSGFSTTTPSFLLNAGAAISRVTTQAPFGAACLQVVTTNASVFQGAVFALGVLPAGSYQFSVSVKGNAGGEQLSVYGGPAAAGGSATQVLATTAFTRQTVTFTADGIAAQYVAVRTNPAANTTFFIDGLQVVAGSVSPAYFDGDSDAGNWTGTAHASTSQLYSDSALNDFTADLGSKANVASASGVLKPVNRGLVDDFSADTITAGLWAVETGAGTIAVSGGQLVPSSTATKQLYRTDSAAYADVRITEKYTAGASVASGTVALLARRSGVNDFLWARTVVSGASSKVQIWKRVAGADTQLGADSAVFTLAAATSYWVAFTLQGTALKVEHFTADPATGAAAVQSTTYTLTAAEAALFVQGNCGTWLIPQATDWRYDDFKVDTLGVETRLIHTARGYNYGDVECQVKTTPGTTITGYKIGRVFNWVDANNFIEVYVDDNGTNSRLRIDVMLAGVRSNRFTTNLAARLVTGTPFWPRGRIEGNVVFAEYFTGPPARLGTPTTSGSYQLSAAEAAVLGATAVGKTGLSWIPQSSNATITDYVDWPFTYNGDTAAYAPGLQDWPLAGPIPGDAPALAALTVSTPTLASGIPWYAFGWMPEPATFNHCWNGDFEEVPMAAGGWGVAAVTNINGAATSVNRVTTGVVKSGTCAGEIVTPATSGVGVSFHLYRKYRRGITYTFDVWVYSAAQVTSVSARMGNSAANDVATGPGVPLTAGYQKLTVQWTPTADRTDAHVAVIINAATATTFRIDGVEVYEGTVAPTTKNQTEGRGAVPPLGHLQAEACRIDSNFQGFVVTADAASRHGANLTLSGITSSGATGVASWYVDPTLLTTDDFVTDEVQVEVFARINPSSLNFSTITVFLNYQPNSSSAARLPAEFPTTATAKIISQANLADALYRLGTLSLPTSSRQGRGVINVTIQALASTGTQSLAFDELVILPVRRRAAGPTGKNINGYPLFLPGDATYLITKTIAPDLSGVLAQNEFPPTPSGGLGGSLLELPPGALHLITRPSAVVPDPPGGAGTADSSVRATKAHIGVTPRWQLARDA